MDSLPLRNSAWVVALSVVVAAGMVLLAGLAVSMQGKSPRAQVAEGAAAEPVQEAQRPQSPEEARFSKARRQMVERDLKQRDITDKRVLAAMGRVERHRFVPEDLREVAYADRPLPIGHQQTISQPYIVALMTQVVRPKATDRVLDVGTGSGYQTAMLAELCKDVYSIEIVKPLAETAKKRLAKLGYKNVTVRSGDGYRGWKEHAPFDVIVVAAAPDHVPGPLIEQLAPGGRLVIPVGDFWQELLLIEKDREGKVGRKKIALVAFVPMTGEAEQRKD